MTLFSRWRMQRDCWHHNPTTGETWILSRLIDAGARKRSRCYRCERTWIV